MQQHICRGLSKYTEGKKMRVKLISPGNVRSLLKSLKKMVAKKIVHKIRCQKKACVIFNSMQEYTKRKPSVFLMRYLESDSNVELYICE